MKRKKYFILIFIIYFIKPFLLFSEEEPYKEEYSVQAKTSLNEKKWGFDRFVFAAAGGMGICVNLSPSNKADDTVFFGPSLKFDTQFLFKSGFSLLITNELNFPFLYDNTKKKIEPPTGSLWNFGFLAGYTFALKNDLEMTLAGGFGGVMMIMPQIIAQFSLSKFFTEVCGIYFAVSNKFIIIPDLFFNTRNIYFLNIFDAVLGISFRIPRRTKNKIKG